MIYEVNSLTINTNSLENAEGYLKNSNSFTTKVFCWVQNLIYIELTLFQNSFRVKKYPFDDSLYLAAYFTETAGPKILALSFVFVQLSLQKLALFFCHMSKKEMTLVYYYIPEDKDDPDCPNVFGVAQSKANIRLSHIHQSFPLKGSYIFRFKHSLEGSAVWLDLPDIQSKLPTFKDRIIIKATRVQWNESKLHSQYKEKQVPLPQPSKKNEEINVFEGSNFSQPVKPAEIKQQQNLKNHNLLDEKTIPIQVSPKQNYNDFNLFDGVPHNGSPLTVNHGNNQKPYSIDFMQDFKHGDLI